jgi:transposase
MRLRRSRLTAQQTERLLEHFVAGTPARTSSELVGVNRNTATYFYHRLREVIARHLESTSPLAKTASWPNSESARGDTRKSSAGSSATGKVAVLVLLERGGKVYTVLVPDTGRDALSPVLQAGFKPASTVHADTLGTCDLLDFLGRRDRRFRRGERVTHRLVRIGGVENFCSQARRNLLKYNGIPAHHFHLFLKECEWRFNYGSPRRLLETLVRWLAEQAH